VSSIDHLHISDFDFKIICFTGVIHVHAKFNEINVFFFQSPVQNLNVVTTCEFSTYSKVIH